MRGGGWNLWRWGGFLRSLSIGVNARELGAKKENLGGIIDPNNHGNQRSRCAVGRSHAGFAEIESQEKFSDREEKSGTDRADANIAPRHVGGGHVPEQKRKENGNHGEGD